MDPAYKLEEFILACKDILRVAVRDRAQKDARDHFKLNTKKELLRLISANVMESLCHINTKLWERNPNLHNIIMIDAYSFYSGKKFGYVAFRYNITNDTWFIKSFKLNREPDPRNRPFEGLEKLMALRKLEE